MPLPDFEKWGEVERQPMSNIRRKTAEHLSYAWNTIPHVTQFDKADITPMEELRSEIHASRSSKAGGNLTVTAVLVKILAAAVKQFPQFNASIDPERGEIIYKKYVNVGVAVDTERGLLVPVIRNADQKNITQIAVEMQPARREGARPQADARRDERRRHQHLEPRRHRRHLLHADRQLAGGGDPRRVARRIEPVVEGRPQDDSSRGRCCRCRSPTTTA